MCIKKAILLYLVNTEKYEFLFYLDFLLYIYMPVKRSMSHKLTMWVCVLC